MKRFFLLITALFLLGAGSDSAPPGWTGETPERLKTAVEGNSAFALELFGRLKDREGNLFFSPYSISTALAMAYDGARGKTEKEISAALHFDADQKKFHSAMSEIRKTLLEDAKKSNAELIIANGLWPQKDYEFRDEYLRSVREGYAAAIEFVDFPSSPGSVVSKINAWIARNTKNKLNGVLPPNDVTSNTRLVIANAVYFKADWASRFPREQTRNEPFWISAENSVSTPMMFQEHAFSYAEAEGVKLLLMPYIGDRLAMVVVLPDRRDGLRQIEQTLDAKKLNGWLGRLRPRTVDVRFPKFAVEYRTSLVDTLQSMGMRDAFGQTADFTGMTPKRPLFINAVEHAALVEVDEEGTVAAAATSISFGCSKKQSYPPAVFHADHPFLFLIVDLRTHAILFLGRMANPTR